MTESEVLTDKYLAELLAKDAKDASIRYSAIGLEGYASKQPNNKPKPNTRFLRNIIKETDNHNAALLAKEAADARSKLDSLSRPAEQDGRAARAGSEQTRKRQLGSIQAILGAAKDGQTARAPRTKRDDESKDPHGIERRRNARRREEDAERAARRVNTSSEDEAREEDRQQRRKWRHELRALGINDRSLKDRRKRRRDESSGDDSDARHRKDRKRRDMKGSPEARKPEAPSQSRSRRHEETSATSRSASLTASRDDTRLASGRMIHESRPESESDPLEELIGPMPGLEVMGDHESRPRGRGRATYSNMDDPNPRLASDYASRLDITPEADAKGDDWDQALEALRDRQKWLEKGANRLRAAGFTDNQIGKWKQSGSGARELDESDVVWNKTGEDREWDRGKDTDEPEAG